MGRSLKEELLSHLSVHQTKDVIEASIGLFIFFNFIALLLLVNLPGDFLVKHHRRMSEKGIPNFVRKILGVLLIMIGGVLSLHGVAGPGFIFVLIGLFFLGAIRREKVERFLTSRPALLARINRLRAWFKKPPLMLPPED